MKKAPKDMPLLEEKQGNVVLFYPHIPENAIQEVEDTLRSRWIGQGPKVERFEQRFKEKFSPSFESVAVGAGTDALHLAYILAGIQPGDEVISPVFTCTATNIPLLYIGAKVKFADIQMDTLNIDPKHVRQLVNEKTKAIICVHYGGLPCDMDELHEIGRQWGIPVIEDAAHALGASYHGQLIGSISDYTMFSFQAIKTLTTGDGGMLLIKDKNKLEKARRIRWFGIDRVGKQNGNWENDIWEVGYKYQMTDISAAIGLASLEEFDSVFDYRRKLFNLYKEGLKDVPGIKLAGAEYQDREHGYWLCTVLVEHRIELQKKLRENHIESNQVHFRNDMYTLFGGRRDYLPNMDAVEDKYMVLPLHLKVQPEDVNRICDLIRSGW
jgi:perosamine synthetase